jgi:hypothetical protein
MTGHVDRIDAQTQDRRLAMDDLARIEQTHETMLTFEVSDEAIENAAGSVNEKAASFTLAFCSGVDSCPS